MGEIQTEIKLLNQCSQFIFRSAVVFYTSLKDFSTRFSLKYFRVMQGLHIKLIDFVLFCSYVFVMY